MESLLIKFVDTLDSSLKSLVKELGENSGFTRLTINQFQYLEAIYQLGEPTITEIAMRLKFTKASVTAGVNKLVALGYLQKIQSQTDRRSYHISLSDSGSKLILAKLMAFESYSQFIRAALTPEEYDQFQAILLKLVQHFKQP